MSLSFSAQLPPPCLKIPRFTGTNIPEFYENKLLEKKAAE
jgi:hypothetical protein